MTCVDFSITRARGRSAYLSPATPSNRRNVQQDTGTDIPRDADTFADVVCRWRNSKNYLDGHLNNSICTIECVLATKPGFDRTRSSVHISRISLASSFVFRRAGFRQNVQEWTHTVVLSIPLRRFAFVEYLTVVKYLISRGKVNVRDHPAKKLPGFLEQFQPLRD